MVLPTGIYEAIPSGFLDIKGGTKTSAQWRTWTEVYVPLIWPDIWQMNRNIPPGHRDHNPALTDSELRCSLLLSEVNVVALRPNISRTQVAVLRTLIRQWQDLVFLLHPGIQRTRNWHQIAHIVDDILLHGPVYSTWVFAAERLGKLLKQINTNGKQIETTLLQAQYRSATAALLHALLVAGATTPAERLAAANLTRIREDTTERGTAAAEFLDQMITDLDELETGVNLAFSAPSNATLKPTHGTAQAISARAWPAIQKRLKLEDPDHDYLLEGDPAINRLSPRQLIVRQKSTRYTGLKGPTKRFRVWNDKSGNYRTCNLAEYRDTLFHFQQMASVYDPVKVASGDDLCLIAGLYDVEVTNHEAVIQQRLWLIFRQAVSYAMPPTAGNPYQCLIDQ